MGKYSITCNLDNEKYYYEIKYDKNYEPSGGDAWLTDHIDIEKLDNANKVVARLEDYFCVLQKQNLKLFWYLDLNYIIYNILLVKWKVKFHFPKPI